MNKQYLRSLYENKEKCVPNGVLLKELCLLRGVECWLQT